jgi:hypothetical protein
MPAKRSVLCMPTNRSIPVGDRLHATTTASSLSPVARPSLSPRMGNAEGKSPFASSPLQPHPLFAPTRSRCSLLAPMHHLMPSCHQPPISITNEHPTTVVVLCRCPHRKSPTNTATQALSPVTVFLRESSPCHQVHELRAAPLSLPDLKNYAGDLMSALQSDFPLLLNSPSSTTLLR